MGINQTIRDHGKWVMIVMVALALGGFIIMDIMTGQGSLWGNSQAVMGSIEGEKVDIREFNSTEQMLYRGGGDSYAQRNALWNYMVEKRLVEKEAENLGLGVGDEELEELMYGQNLSPIITSRFTDPTTGQVDRNRLNQIRQTLESGSTDVDPNFLRFWEYQKGEIIKDRLQTKMAELAAKAIYVPSWQAQMIANDESKTRTAAYVKIPLDAIPDDEVTLEDQDYKAYLQEYGWKYKQDEEVRRLQYIVFEVKPTAKDSMKIRQKLEEDIAQFKTTSNDTLFIQNHNGTFDGAYYKKSELSPLVADTLFKMPVGEVYGPYVEADQYKAVKLLDRKVVPDSVRARHILIRVDQNSSPQQISQAFATIDSLKQLIEEGKASFDSLALQFGQDGTAAKGGDLGFAAPGQMVKPFNDLIFFEAEPGKLYTVTTQFGLHLVEVTDRKFINKDEAVKVGYISRYITPSQETQKTVQLKALELAESYKKWDELVKAAKQKYPDIKVQTSNPVKRNDYFISGLGGGNTSRDMVRWAFGDDPNLEDPQPGDASPVIYRYQHPERLYYEKFVVAGLKGIQKAGIPAVQEVKEEIEQDVLNWKKAQVIAERVKGKSDLSSVAAQFQLQVDTAANVKFTASSVQGIGPEPKVIAAIFLTPLTSVSDPIIGDSGVFLVKPLEETPQPAMAVDQVRRLQLTSLQSNVRARFMQALRKKARIKDYRANFF